jgi:hypothetical protein
MIRPTSPYSIASVGREPEVAAGVLLDPLQRLAGLLGEDAVEPLTHLDDLARLDVDVRRRAARAARRLVQQEAGVRQADPVLPRHRDVDQRAGARHPAGPHDPDRGFTKRIMSWIVSPDSTCPPCELMKMVIGSSETADIASSCAITLDASAGSPRR